jgi:hypothetical protein
MGFVNLTPHAIVVRIGDRDETFEPSGAIARLEVVDSEAWRVGGIPCVRRDFVLASIPEPKPGVVYIVSAMVLAETKKIFREDFVAPDTGSGAIRNEKGHIVAVTGFIC